MTTQIIVGVVRHILTLAGGWLVAKGYTDDATAQQITGYIVAIIGFAWSIVEKKKNSSASIKASKQPQ